MSEPVRCEWCSTKMPPQLSVGRRRRYCCQSCRQRAYEKRQEQERPVAGAPSDRDSVTVRRSELESLQDRLYVLRSAIDVLSDTVGEDSTPSELRAVAREVVAAGGDLDRLWISP